MSESTIQSEPSAIDAERAVLGIALRSETEAQELVRRGKTDDFYLPAHMSVFTAISNLVNDRAPIDAVSVWTQVQRDGNARALTEGALTVYGLVEAAPPTPSFAHHLKIVKDTANRRRLARASVQGQALAADPSKGSAIEVAEFMQQAINNVTADFVDQDIPLLGDFLDDVYTEVERIGKEGAVVGVPTGFPDLDAKLHGLRPGQDIIVAGRPGSGKALALDTPIATPTGWTTMGDIQVGDLVFGEDGQPTRVVAATDVMHDRPCYRVTFSDGSTIVADAEHLWVTETNAFRRSRRELKRGNAEPRRWLSATVRSRLENMLATAGDTDVLTAPQVAELLGVTRSSHALADLLNRVAPVDTVPTDWTRQVQFFDGKRALKALGLKQTLATRYEDGLMSREDLLAESGMSYKQVRTRLTAAGITASVTKTVTTVTNRRIDAYSTSAVIVAALMRDDEAAERAKALCDRVIEPITTRDIASSLLTVDGKSNHAIRVTAPLNLPDASLPLDPYLLGVWLGDGTTGASTVTSADPEVLEEIVTRGFHVTHSSSARYRHTVRFTAPASKRVTPIRACGVCGEEFAPDQGAQVFCSLACSNDRRQGKWGKALRDTPHTPASCDLCGNAFTGFEGGRCRSCREVGLRAALADLGVLHGKHIPADYLRGSESQRRDLLAGLLDTDGSAGKQGESHFHTTNPTLAKQVRELVCSLGYRAHLTRKRVKGRTAATSTAFTVSFTTADEVFQLPRKNARVAAGQRTSSSERRIYRYITDVESVDSVPVRCIQVDNSSHLYLAGETLIPTHNSTLAVDIARNAAFHCDKSILMFSLEMSKEELANRIISAEARIELASLQTGDMSEAEWQRIFAANDRMARSKFGIDDTPGVTIPDIRAKAQAYKNKYGLDMIVIDYLQLMTPARRLPSREQEVSEISRNVKLIAKEYGVPVIALSQLNRGAEQRADKRPQLSDLRESGSLEQDADVVMMIHRDELYNPEERVGEADIIIAKHRGGPTGIVPVVAQLHFSRFVPAAFSLDRGSGTPESQALHGDASGTAASNW